MNISPLPLLRERQFTRKWAMSSGAVSFLHKNGFDFGRQIIHGVPYLSLQEEEKARAKMTADSKREDMLLKPEDQTLVQHIRDSVTTWQSQPKEEQEEWLNIPHGTSDGIPTELNSYQRRLVYQIVQNEFPAMKTQGMGHFIQITNPTTEQVASQKQLEAEQRERDLARAVGFRWIMDGIIGRDLSKLPNDYLLPALPRTANAADGDEPVKALLEDLVRKLKERRKVLVGHNCMVDIMFLYKMIIGDLPETLQEFKDRVHAMFPAIIDTKFLSSCFSEKHGRLALGEVEKDLSLEAGLFPHMYMSTEFNRYVNNSWLHEAGYDSYITAIVAIKMATKLQRDGSRRKNDHDRQQQEVADAAISAPPSFGGRGENAAATGSVDQTIETGPEASLQNHDLHSLAGSNSSPVQKESSSEQADSTISGSRFDSITSAISNTSSTLEHSTVEPSTPSSVIAVKVKSKASPQAHSRHGSRSVSGKDEPQVASLRSAFASTSLYDSLGTSSEMPGDSAENANQTVNETKQERMDRFVKEGRMMPRWTEEAAFWEVYGNKLQVNGTAEGVMNIVD